MPHQSCEKAAAADRREPALVSGGFGLIIGDRTLDVIVERTRCLCGIESVRNLIHELEKLSALYSGASESAGELATELKRLHSELVEGCLHWRERAVAAQDGKEQLLFGAKWERC